MPTSVSIALPSTAAEWVALVGGMVGCVLGIRAEWRAATAHKPRLQVTPLVGWSTPQTPMPPRMLGVEVVNHSAFPVTIDEVGFLNDGSDNRWAFVNPYTIDDSPWPRRLEVQEAEIFYISAERLPPDQLRRIKCAYARSSTKAIVKGTSKALDYVRRNGTVPANSPVSMRGAGTYSTRVL